MYPVPNWKLWSSKTIRVTGMQHFPERERSEIVFHELSVIPRLLESMKISRITRPEDRTRFKFCRYTVPVADTASQLTYLRERSSRPKIPETFHGAHFNSTRATCLNVRYVTAGQSGMQDTQLCYGTNVISASCGQEFAQALRPAGCITSHVYVCVYVWACLRARDTPTHTSLSTTGE